MSSGSSIVLGHTRLRVVDLSDAGAQPMSSSDGRYVLVYNGEVYDFRNLRRRLEGLGHAFDSAADSEVVLHAWAQWGPACLGGLDGMFAFAIWDRRERQLYLVRDRLGIKPLYYHYAAARGALAFASEVRALLASGLLTPRLDPHALRSFLSQQTVPTPDSLIMGVWTVPPGCWLRVRLKDGRVGTPEIWRYWDPLEAAEGRRDELAAADRTPLLCGLLERLQLAVERRMVADVPLGAFLSGGVDSSTIVGLMSRASATPVRTFSVAFDDPGYDDGPYARLAAAHFGTEHLEVRLSDDELVECIPAAVASQDHPSGDGINTWIVSQAAREAGLTVALSGLGGDELFGGYPSFGRLAMLARTRPILGPIPRHGRAAVGTLLRRVRPGVAGSKAAALLQTDGSVAEAYPILREVFAPLEADRLLTLPGPNGRAEGRPYTDSLRHALGMRSTVPTLACVAYAELTCYMRDVLLRDTDQMSMAHSLEVRVPFLDREVVEYALALPEEARRPTNPPKRFLIGAVADLLPQSVAERPKSGFAMPFDRWMRGPLRPFCEEGVEAVAAHEAFRGDAVDEVWRGFLAGDPAVPWSRPWLLVALGHWIERETVA